MADMIAEANALGDKQTRYFMDLMCTFQHQISEGVRKEVHDALRPFRELLGTTPEITLGFKDAKAIYEIGVGVF